MSRNIGDKIKYVRQQKHMTQCELARMAGVAQSTLSYIEKGGKKPRFETLRALCRALNVTMLELLVSGEDTKPGRFLREERATEMASCSARDFERYLYRLYLLDKELPAVASSVCESGEADMKIYTLVEGSRRKGAGFLPDDGLSLYFEYGAHRVLFDTGASDAFIYNATLLGIDLSKVDTCVISHAHSHHTGGLFHFLEINSFATVWMKRAARGDFCIRRPARMEPHGINPELFQKYGERIRFIDDDTQLFEGVTATGISNHRKLPAYASLLYEQREGEFVHDTLEHELFLAVRTDAGTAGADRMLAQRRHQHTAMRRG